MLQCFTGLHQDNHWFATVCEDIDTASRLFGPDVHPIIVSGASAVDETQVVWDSPKQVFLQVLRPRSKWVPLEGALPVDDANRDALAIAAVYFRMGSFATTARLAEEELVDNARQAALAAWAEVYYYCRRQGAGDGLAKRTTDEIFGGSVVSSDPFAPAPAEKQFAAAFLQCLLDDPDHRDFEY